MIRDIPIESDESKKAAKQEVSLGKIISLGYISKWLKLAKDTAGLVKSSVEKGKFYYIIIGEAFDVYDQAKKKASSAFDELVERIIG